VKVFWEEMQKKLNNSYGDLNELFKENKKYDFTDNDYFDNNNNNNNNNTSNKDNISNIKNEKKYEDPENKDFLRYVNNDPHSMDLNNSNTER